MASTVSQAKVIFDTVANFAQSPVIKNRLHVKEHINEIRDRTGKGKIKIISSTSVQGSSGANTSLIVMDEFCEWRSSIASSIYGRLKNSDIAKKGGGGRKIVISTPQDDIAHPGKRLWQQAKDIQSGESDDLHTLPVVYGADMDDDPALEATWFKAQPALGKIVPVEAYRSDWEQSKNDPHEQARFRTLLLGQWVGSISAFLAPEVWHNNKSTYSEQDFYGADVVGGFDFGGRYDLLAWVWLAKKDEKLFIIPRFGLPQKIIERKTKQESKDYLGWSQSKLIRTCEGEVIDLEWWKSQIKDDLNLFNVKAIAMDDYNLEFMRQWLEDEKGIDVVCVKTWVYNEISPLTSQFEALVKAGTIKHNDNPVLNWNIDCLTIKTNEHGLIKPDKRRGTAKIDGAVATIVGLAALNYLDQQIDFCGILGD